MDFDALTAFARVVDTGSFGAAAGDLHLTQPAISKRIASLERQLGQRLFDRTGKGIRLTEAGNHLLPRTRRILAEIEDARRELANIGQEVGGELSIATNHHIGVWRLPAVLKAFRQEHPDVALDLHFMDSEVAHSLVADGSVELGIVTLAPSGYSGVTSVHAWDDELAFLVSSDHPLANSGETTLAALGEYPAILPDHRTYTGRIITSLFEQADVPLQRIMSSNYLETLKMMVSIGLGWSMLPRVMHDPGLCTLDVPGVQISRQLGVIHHARFSLSNAALAMLGLIAPGWRDANPER